MSKKQDLFFELLLVCTGQRDSLRQSYTQEQWEGALVVAKEQAIVGVLLSALERLPKEQLPPKEVLFQWIGYTEMLESYSLKVAKGSNAVIKYFRDNGFACQILKGSAVARYYPQPNKRSSGDIDVWLDGNRKEIYEFARNFDKNGMLYGVNYHHIHFHLFEDIPIEVHIWPSYLSSPLRNHRLHQLCNMYRPTMNASMPCLAFDRIFILLHCYRHICGDGVGLRQVMDYFFVLRQGFTETERHDAVEWIKKLGMEHFAKGLMWVLQKVFGMEDQYLIVKPSEKEGCFILNEILLTGNMGHSDKRSWGSKKTAFSRFILNLRRDFYIAKHYPHEAIWQPFFSVWLYLWRFYKGLLKDRND